MKDYKLGTHNSMSYLPPKKWWHKPFHFMSKCQEVSIEEQYEKYNARYFDIRIRQDKDGKWYFAHGQSLYYKEGVTINSVCRYLDSKEDVVVRLVLEELKRNATKEANFITVCEILHHTYKNITFVGFNTKADWSPLYSYEGQPKISCYEACSSTTGSILDDWFPFIYAKTFNKDNKRQGCDYDYLLFDFINIE